MQYEPIFDVTQNGFRNWTFPAFGLVFVAIGLFLLKNRASLSRMFPGKLGPKDGAKLAYFVLAISILWTAGAFVTSGRDYRALRRALKEGNVDVVEGRVENFVSIPDKSERFTVCGAAFSYSDYLVTAGFNNTSSHGGPIRPGIWVRIAHMGNSIARLEVAKGEVGQKMTCHPSSRRTIR